MPNAVQSGGDKSRGRKSAAGMEWSLRSLRKIDSGRQHFLTSYWEDDESDEDEQTDVFDESAYEIFKGREDRKQKLEPGEALASRPAIWAALNAPLRRGVVDGREVVFELLTDVTQKPAIPRSERVKIHYVNKNAKISSLETRWRYWLMHLQLGELTLAFFASFIALNALFAGFFYLENQRCCGDPTHTYSHCFNFSVQTATTLGYGVLSPVGPLSNFLVIMLSFLSTLLNMLFAGLLFTKFVTPSINIQFSDVMTLCNVNGVPCLNVRLGNAEGSLNALTDINVRLTYSYQIPYTDHNGEQKCFRQTERLPLLSDRQHGLKEVWELRHVLDETSPLFGLNFGEHPGNKIYIFTLSIDAVQDLTKSSVNVQEMYALEDILIGRSFQNLLTFDPYDKNIAISDFSKMSDTEPYPVWYPAKKNAYSKNI